MTAANGPEVPRLPIGGGPSWIGSDIEAGRFFEGEHVARRIAPFASAGIVAFLLLPLLEVSYLDWRVLAAAVLVALIGAAIFLVPWQRLPRWAQALPVLASYIAIGLLRDAGGEDAAVFEPLLIIPIAFFALYGTGGMLVAGALGLGLTMLVPVVAIGEPTYDDSQAIRAVIAMTIVLTTGGAVQSLVGSMRRLTAESRGVLTALKEAEERFRRAFEENRVGMVLVTPEGEFMRVNGAFCELLGYAAEDLLGRGFQEITHPDDIDANLTALEEIAAGERYGYRAEKRCRHS